MIVFDLFWFTAILTTLFTENMLHLGGLYARETFLGPKEGFVVRRFTFLLVFVFLVGWSPLVFSSGDAEVEDADETVEDVDVIQATIAVAPPDYTHLAAEAFSAYVAAATDGQIQISTVVHDALGGDQEATDQLAIGELEFNLAGGGGLAHVIPDVQVYNWPFLFANRSEFYELMMEEQYVEDITAHFLEQTNDEIRFLAAGENSIRHLYITEGPIRVPQDLTDYGISMRTRELPLDQRLFQELGVAEVVALPAPERYSALQTGLIDATEGGLASAWAAGLLEVQEHVTLTGHAYDYFTLVANNDFYESLTSDQQLAIQEGARVAMWVNNGHAITEEQDVVNLMLEEGVQIYTPTPGELAQWQEIANRVGEEVMPDLVSQDFIDLTMDALERVKARLAQRSGQ